MITQGMLDVVIAVHRLCIEQELVLNSSNVEYDFGVSPEKHIGQLGALDMMRSNRATYKITLDATEGANTHELALAKERLRELEELNNAEHRTNDDGPGAAGGGGGGADDGTAGHGAGR